MCAQVHQLLSNAFVVYGHMYVMQRTLPPWQVMWIFLCTASDKHSLLRDRHKTTNETHQDTLLGVAVQY